MLEKYKRQNPEGKTCKSLCVLNLNINTLNAEKHRCKKFLVAAKIDKAACNVSTKFHTPSIQIDRTVSDNTKIRIISTFTTIW